VVGAGMLWRARGADAAPGGRLRGRNANAVSKRGAGPGPRDDTGGEPPGALEGPGGGLAWGTGAP
jgi:hypothetical protein